MTLSWIVAALSADWLIKSSALILIAWAATIAARKLGAPAALRHWLWLLAVASAAALPLATTLTPVRWAVLPGVEARAPQMTSVMAPVGWTFVDAASLLYAVVSAILLLRIAVGQWRLAALWRNSRTVASVELQTSSLAKTMGLSRRVDVRVASDECAPMTWGLLRPKVLLPASAVRWPAAQRQLVLMHELAHVARADSATQVLGSAAAALYWIQPAFWFALAQLRREQEHACDDRVLLAGAPAQRYAETLLEVAAGRGDFAPPAAMMGERSHLEDRLSDIVGQRRRGVGVAGIAMASIGALMALMAAAVAAPAPAPAAARAPTAPASTARARPPAPVAAPSALSRLASQAQQSTRGLFGASVTQDDEAREGRFVASSVPAIPTIPLVPAIPAVPDVDPAPPIPVVPRAYRPSHRGAPAAQPP